MYYVYMYTVFHLCLWLCLFIQYTQYVQLYKCLDKENYLYVIKAASKP